MGNVIDCKYNHDHIVSVDPVIGCSIDAWGYINANKGSFVKFKIILKNSDIKIKKIYISHNEKISNVNLPYQLLGNEVTVCFTMPGSRLVMLAIDTENQGGKEMLKREHIIYTEKNPRCIISIVDKPEGIHPSASVDEKVRVVVISKYGYKRASKVTVILRGSGESVELNNVSNSNTNILGFSFIMPDDDVEISAYVEESDQQEFVNEPSNNIIDHFMIPDELAKELSELLTKQTIREKVLVQVIDDPDKYEKMEAMLVPITSKIESIKVKITREYVPEEYNSPEFMWNYEGYDIDKNNVQILKMK